jgi:mRNA interferase MazF
VSYPIRGEVWHINLDPRHPLEQAGERPCLIISADRYNSGRSGRVIILPITTRPGLPFTVEVHPPEGGLREISYILCDQIRAVNKNRLKSRYGKVSDQTMADVENMVIPLLDL